MHLTNFGAYFKSTYCSKLGWVEDSVSLRDTKGSSLSSSESFDSLRIGIRHETLAIG